MRANTLSRQIAKNGFEFDRAVYNPSGLVRGYGSWRPGFHVNETGTDGVVNIRWIHSGREIAIDRGAKKMPLIADALRALGYSVQVIPVGEYDKVIRLTVRKEQI